MVSKLITLALTLGLTLTLTLTLTTGEGLTQFEEEYLTLPTPTQSREALQTYTLFPHVAGTEREKELADFTVSAWEDAGWEASLFESSAILNTPVSQSLTMTSPVAYSAPMTEPALVEDPTSNRTNVLPAFNGYGPSGRVEDARVVYVNFASSDDFATLDALGIDPSGALCLARYGGLFRGTKVQLASLHGCAGLVLYSDPQQDGFVRGPVVPNGPWRPEYSFQRGSVQYLNMCPGDPRRIKECLGPDAPPGGQGVDAFKGRLTPDIPVIPISYGAASPFLKNMGGTPVPQGWQGGLDFDYHIGDDPNAPVLATLDVQVEWSTPPLYSVIGELKGEGPDADSVVLLSNHRDAWVMGGIDPSSGSAVLMSIVKSLGTLYKNGWRPSRTIRAGSWAGEEYGLLGSVAYGESLSDDDVANLVAVLNLDTAVSGGQFEASATPSLETVVNDVLQHVTHPGQSKPVSQTWDGEFGILGSGSDYTVFLQHLGVPAVDMSFSGSYGVYHSLYDSFWFVETFIDPGFELHACMAKVMGLLAMKLTAPPVPPLDFNVYAARLPAYLDIVDSYAKSESVSLDLSPLTSAFADFTAGSETIMTRMENAGSMADGEVADLAQTVRLVERNFVIQGGIPGRPFYRHAIQAPGLVLGYGADVFPGVHDSIYRNEDAEAQTQVYVAASRIRSAAQAMDPSLAPTSASSPQRHSAKLVIVVFVVFVVGIVVVGVAGGGFVYARRQGWISTGSRYSPFSA